MIGILDLLSGIWLIFRWYTHSQSRKSWTLDGLDGRIGRIELVELVGLIELGGLVELVTARKLEHLRSE